MTKTEYKFCRAQVSRASEITAYLQAFAVDGWEVVSHAEGSGEYSFVLKRVRYTS